MNIEEYIASDASLRLFKAVIFNGEIGDIKIVPEYGVVIDAKASSKINLIKDYLKNNALSGSQFNKTFHKSWNKVVKSTREDLLIDQIIHYLSTYGSDFRDVMYIPDEVLEVPNIDISFYTIKGLTKQELLEKCLNLLNMGVAMNKDTIEDIFIVLKACGYKFTGEENFKNKEANMYLCEKTGVLPNNPVEMLRYLIYIATNGTLLIKSKDLYDRIAHIDPARKKLFYSILMELDEKEMAKIFNRFKPIFMAIKKSVVAPKEKLKVHHKINRISKLSKKLHEPMPYNILNDIGACSFEDLENQFDNLKNASFFQLARCLNYLEKSKDATYKAYNIRNGKSFVKRYEGSVKGYEIKKLFILNLIKSKVDLDGVKIYIPEDVEYALPTSEKDFVGGVPAGTQFISDRPIAMGVYWENSWGARDIDVSGISIDGKVGWNSVYDSEVTYSGDITNAPNGAVEYIKVNEDRFSQPHIILSNIFYGEVGCKCRIVYGNHDEITKKHMMDPNSVYFYGDIKTVGKMFCIGIMFKKDDKYVGVVLNRSIGKNNVSGGKNCNKFRTAFYEQYSNSFPLRDIFVHCGANLVDDKYDAEIDLTPSSLDKDTLLNIFK